MSANCLVPEISEIPKECLIVVPSAEGDDYEEYLEELKIRHGYPTALRFVRARSANEARNCLRGRTRPFDLMLMNLPLPENHPKGNADLDQGYDVFKFAKEVEAAKAIVVVSAETQEINEVSRLGGDFVSKINFKKTDLQDAVAKCLRQLAISDSTNKFTARTLKLSPYFERSLIHHFGLYFSRSLQEIDRATDAITRELLERFGLDPGYDSEDFLLQQLQGIRHALQTGKTDWGGLQESLGLSDLSSPQAIDVLSMVTDLERRLRPCAFAKNVVLKIGPLPNEKVLSFKSIQNVPGDTEEALSDVEEVLSEVVLGGLAEQDSRETGKELMLSGEADQNWVTIILSDTLPPLQPQDLEKIKRGAGLSGEKRFSRIWGLSVMQHAALQGGGRLSVETTGEGNTIKYRIPRARNG